MRPVNLIPPEDRRGESAPTRTGALAYVVVGALVVALAAVSGLVFFNKQVSDREAEAAVLESRAAETQARAESLSAFAGFQQVHDARVATIEQLAKSRFDWERVLRELSLVIPRHVWLTSLNGSVSPEAGAGEGSSSSSLRAEIAGPALELAGCGRSHRDIARLIAAMEDIDGVTRVTVTDSQRTDEDAAAQAAPAGSGGSAPLTGDNCQTRSSIPQFNLIAAFDGVPVPAAIEPAPVAPAPPSATATPSSVDGGVADAKAENAKSEGDVTDADRRAENATNLIPGG